MLQEILAQPHWQGRLTATDLRALTPLIWEHVNPYGRFDLDMTTRLPLTFLGATDPAECVFQPVGGELRTALDAARNVLRHG
jgi:hypothetical protein